MNNCTNNVVKKIIIAKERLNVDRCIFTKFINSEHTVFSNCLKWNRMQTHEEQGIVIPIEENDVIIEKQQYSAVTDKLKEMLIAGACDTIYLCGLETDACVLSTAFDLFDFGIVPTILIDCCASARGESYHMAAKKIMERSFGTHNVVELCKCI